MKFVLNQCNPTKGSVLSVVMIVLLIMALLTASMLSVSVSEKRYNESVRIVQRTRNMAENTINYATAQLSAKLKRLRSTSPIKYSTTATGATQLFTPPTNSILLTDRGTSSVDVHAGLFSSTPLTYIDPTDPANASNPYIGLSVITSKGKAVASATISDPRTITYTAYAIQEFFVAQIPIFQYAIFYNPDLEFGPGGDMIIDGPVHTNGILAARDQYQHSNTLQFKSRVTCVEGFYANVTKLGAIYMSDGSADNNTGGSGPLLFQNPSGTVTDIRSGSAPFLWRDYTWSSNAAGSETATTRNQFKTWATTTYAGNFRAGIHGVDKVVLPGIDTLESTTRKNAARTTVEPPSTDDTPTLVDWKFSRHAGLYIIVNPTGTNPDRADGCRVGILPDGTTTLMQPYSYRCWLNTINIDGTHTMTEVVLPGQPSYSPDNGATLITNALPNRFTNKTAIGSNQVLRIPIPAGNVGYTPDTTWGTYTPPITPTTTDKNLDTAPQCLLNAGYTTTATPALTTFTDGYFFDLRRARGNNGYPATRTTTSFEPRPIAKIDFDMTRFRLTIERTMNGATASSLIYNPNIPNGTNWAYNIYNPAPQTKSYGLATRTGAAGAYVYNVFPTDATGRVLSDPFKIYRATPAGSAPIAITSTDLLNTSATSTPWYDGIAIYIHSVDAENRSYQADNLTRNRMDSGVRLVNGRGPVISLTSTNRTGFSLCTNDALYIIGHFNADGTVNSNTASTGYGGYSGRYPDSVNEKLCSVMADAITVLSQPVFSFDSSNNSYYQSSGWSDSLSANSFSTSAWSTNWRTTNPSGSNQYDGITNTVYYGHMPYDGIYTAVTSAKIATNSTMVDGASVVTNYQYYSGTTPKSRTTKFYGSNTEISSCLLVGIVATRSASNPREKEFDGTWCSYQPTGYQNSGGAHNFPRLLEDWTSGGAGLYIRGSMVAMFQSEVACEPWLATRIYSAPGRYWGLHENLRAENAGTGLHDVPLEPIMINISRWHYAEFTPSQYASEVANIEALPSN